jgi:hypothetical protein
LWTGLLTRVDNVPTRGNPDALPNSGALPVVAFGGGALVMAGVFISSGTDCHLQVRTHLANSRSTTSPS